MAHTRTALAASVLVLAFAGLGTLPGCAAKNSAGDENLGTSEDLLTDESEAGNADDSTEAEEEATSGGGDLTDASQGVDPSLPDGEHLAKLKLNPGRFFTPAGCIATTIDKNVVTHVFTNCTGLGGRTWNGTVVATWTRPAANQVQVQRVAKGFKIDGASIDRTVTVVYSKEGGVFKRDRTVSMKGTTEKGKSFSRDAHWVVTWEPSTKCVTRDGSSHTIIGSREHSTSVEGYKRCGIGVFGCPDAGKVKLHRDAPKGSDKVIDIVIVFDGGKKMTISLPDGRKLSRIMLCREPAKVN